MATPASNTHHIGVVLLAAGASRRLGRPKQLLPYVGATLLQHALQAGTAFNPEQVVVVLGANAAAIAHEVKQQGVFVVENKEWNEGMAASIRCGIQTLIQKAFGADGVILMVCDQPFVTVDLLNELIAAHQKTKKAIVACSYGETFGPPVFFHHSLFGELLQLKGDVGARSIVMQHTDKVAVIPFPEGVYDVDTEKDYEQVKSRGAQ